MINMLKKLTFYFSFLVKLLRTLVSPYFQLHKMLCLSFIRPYYTSDPPPPHVTFCVKITHLACLVSRKLILIPIMFFNDSFTSHSVKQIENLRFYTHHIKRHYITLDKNVSHFNFYGKIFSKIPL